MARVALQAAAGVGALLLAACAGPAAGGGGPPSPLQLAARGDDCPPLTLLAGEYRRAVLHHDVAGVAAFVAEEALQCDPDAFVPAEAVRRSLADPRSFLVAALFDGALLRSGAFLSTGWLAREAQAETFARESLMVNVTDVAATSRLPRRALVAYKVPGSIWLEVAFECRSGRWVLQDWGGLECHVAQRAAARPHAGP